MGNRSRNNDFLLVSSYNSYKSTRTKPHSPEIMGGVLALVSGILFLTSWWLSRRAP